LTCEFIRAGEREGNAGANDGCDDDEEDIVSMGGSGWTAVAEETIDELLSRADLSATSDPCRADSAC
jgi:hypothetical protein